MSLEERVPDLSDKELERLYANAIRLAQSGTDRQRVDAERLLPLIGATLEERRSESVAKAEALRAETKRARMAAAIDP